MSAAGRGRAGVFLDRDGVVNVEVHRLSRPGQLELIEGSADGIRLLNEAGAPVVLVTNQSVVARGICTEREVNAVHERLAAMLAAEGARLDAVYYCPHHPDGAVPEYTRVCPDRKPGIGMLERAAMEHGLRLEECFVIGDTTGDIQTAVNAGCRSVLVATGYGGSDGACDVSPTWRARDLREAAAVVLRELG